MKSLLLLCVSLVIVANSVGCRPVVQQTDDDNVGHVSTESGGFGSGPTGTGGNQPADNPAAGIKGSDGTGGP